MEGHASAHGSPTFPVFDPAFAIIPPVEFDVGTCLQQRLSERDELAALQEEEQDAPSVFDDDRSDATPIPGGAYIPHSTHTPLPPSPIYAPSPPTHSPDVPLSAMQRDKLKSRARRDKRRVRVQEASPYPLLKGITLKRVTEAKQSALEIDIDASALPHSKPAWIGDRWASKAKFEFGQPQPPHDLSTGLGGASPTQAEVDALSGTKGFMYVDWLGELSIPILDKNRRVVAVLGGKPRDLIEWQAVTEGASTLLRERLDRIRLSDKQLNHHRAQEAFPALARGWSHGGGQLEPGELTNNVANTELTDELLAHEYFKRLAGFANTLFLMWAPILFTFCQAQLALLAAWKPSMRPNFVSSAFAACTFNFGPRAITAPHLDFANLAWGWCAITALGLFDSQLGGHLILWDLCLIIRFPPGATILIPSALIRHSNVPIRAHEHRCSFVQYSAGGLFRWVRNGFKTDEAFEASATAADLAARETEKEGRWQRGMEMFSIIEDL
ncbi:hypothetical protein C8R43DRAFT_942589 [Mycena crocata]|nr:hypothetical protein C8R43DRAFT_942589 [Mycena crocata]